MVFGIRSKNDHDKTLVGFMLNGVRYSVPIGAVIEILNPMPVVPIPGAPPSVVGVAEHRRLVVPIIDLRKLFELRPFESSGRPKWIVLRTGEEVIGICVDAVTEVFGSSERRTVPDHGLGRARDAIGQACVYRGSLVFALRLDYLVRQVSRLDLAGASAQPASIGAMPKPEGGGGDGGHT